MFDGEHWSLMNTVSVNHQKSPYKWVSKCQDLCVLSCCGPSILRV